MKELYIVPEIEVVLFQADDVIRTSAGDGDNYYDEDEV